MALELSVIRLAVAEAISVGVARGLNVYAYPPVDPQYPTAMVSPGSEYITYQETFGTTPLCEVHLIIILEAISPDPISAQIVIDDLLSSGTGQGSSVIDALYADRTLGGVVADLYVGTATIQQVTDAGKTQFTVTASVPVQILIRR